SRSTRASPPSRPARRPTPWPPTGSGSAASWSPPSGRCGCRGARPPAGRCGRRTTWPAPCSTRAWRTGRWTPTSPPPRTCCPASPGCIPDLRPAGSSRVRPGRRRADAQGRLADDPPPAGLAVDDVDDEPDGGVDDAVDVPVDGGQRRGEQRRHRMVVVPADGDVAGDVEAQLAGGGVDAVGDRVGEAEHRAGPRRTAQRLDGD